MNGKPKKGLWGKYENVDPSLGGSWRRGIRGHEVIVAVSILTQCPLLRELHDDDEPPQPQNSGMFLIRFS